MKKAFISIIAAIALMLPAFATDWVQVTDKWYVDMDTIKTDGDYVNVWTKFDGSNMKSYKSMPNVHWIYRLESFNKNSDYYSILNEIVYDEDMQIIENILNPYGSTPQKITSDSAQNVIKDTVFKEQKTLPLE